MTSVIVPALAVRHDRGTRAVMACDKGIEINSRWVRLCSASSKTALASLDSSSWAPPQIDVASATSVAKFMRCRPVSSTVFGSSVLFAIGDHQRQRPRRINNRLPRGILPGIARSSFSLTAH